MEKQIIYMSKTGATYYYTDDDSQWNFIVDIESIFGKNYEVVDMTSEQELEVEKEY